MKIGYSFWGFLGSSVLDTPDGGRSHRRTLIDGLINAGHELVLLQRNRDLEEAGQDLRPGYRWDDELPDLDALFLEWRWPIAGRNTTECGSPEHTCDLHRQRELVTTYTIERSTPTLLWDKDLTLPKADRLRGIGNVAVCEPALHPSPGATSVLFPIADAVLEAADPVALAGRARSLPLVHVGNQYERDDAFDTHFAPAARHIEHRIAGKWTRTGRWPDLNFTGRCHFSDVDALYSSTLATVLLLPERYARAGQMTQRIFESVLAGCLPLTPRTIRAADRFTPAALHVAGAADVLTSVRRLQRLAGTPANVDLIADCLRYLEVFRLSTQLTAIDRLLQRLHDASRPSSARHPAGALPVHDTYAGGS